MLDTVVIVVTGHPAALTVPGQRYERINQRNVKHSVTDMAAERLHRKHSPLSSRDREQTHRLEEIQIKQRALSFIDCGSNILWWEIQEALCTAIINNDQRVFVVI